MGKVTIAGTGGGADLDVITAVKDDVLAGKVIVGPDGEPMTGTMQSMIGGTYSPGTAQQIIACAGKKMESDVVIPGSADLAAGNIAYGKNIFGISGNVRKYGVCAPTVWGGGSRYFTGTNSGNYSFISFSPGFTPFNFMATFENSPHTIVYKSSWGSIVHVDPDYNPANPEFWGHPFTASSVIIPVPRSGNYFVYCTGYY